MVSVCQSATHHRRGIEAGPPETPHPHRAAHRPDVAATVGVRGKRHHRVGKADAENIEEEEHLGPEHAGGKLARPQPPEHEHVGRPDRHLRQLRADKRQAEDDGGAQMPRPGLHACRFAFPDPAHRHGSPPLRGPAASAGRARSTGGQYARPRPAYAQFGGEIQPAACTARKPPRADAPPRRPSSPGFARTGDTPFTANSSRAASLWLQTG